MYTLENITSTLFLDMWMGLGDRGGWVLEALSGISNNQEGQINVSLEERGGWTTPTLERATWPCQGIDASPHPGGFLCVNDSCFFLILAFPYPFIYDLIISPLLSYGLLLFVLSLVRTAHTSYLIGKCSLIERWGINVLYSPTGQVLSTWQCSSYRFYYHKSGINKEQILGLGSYLVPIECSFIS